MLPTYMRAKMAHSLHHFREPLRDNLYEWAKLKESKIREWVESRQIDPVEPSYLLYMIAALND
ncbi:TetR family transcriptional regulator C-terminal domain-containing protein [Vreelandella neptunia]|uniref:TetR family transcriptional regulator C-terminal domain-containing protein n=1 Tax=Vreelandella neptunia TaxID=115551 RepID=UPI003CC9169C